LCDQRRKRKVRVRVRVSGVAQKIEAALRFRSEEEGERGFQKKE